eukprot:g3364.t1
MVDEEREKADTTPLKITMKELFIKIYVPFLVVGTVYQGQNILIPLFLKLRFYSSDTFIGLAATVESIGNLLAAVPVGKAIEQFGTRNTQLCSLILFVVAFVVGGVMEVPELILVTKILIGIGFCQYHLPQHTFLSGNVHVSIRGKAMAYTGGTHRVAGIIGPLMVALFASFLSLQNCFFCLVPFFILNFVWQYFNFFDSVSTKHLTDRKEQKEMKMQSKNENSNNSSAALNLSVAEAGTSTTTSNKRNDEVSMQTINPSSRISTLQIMYDFRIILVRICIYCILLTFVRYGRVLMIPLFGLALNLSVTEIAIISSASYFCGASMFPVSGFIMDRFGRKKNAFITCFIMAIGFLMMYVSKNFGLLLASGMLIGFGNGLSSGLVMTLGGDLAPNDKRRGPFLGIYKLLISIGQLIGPLVAGAISDMFGVQGGAIVCLTVAILACIWVALFIPETSNLGNNSSGGNGDKENLVMAIKDVIVIETVEKEGHK